jgi:hypothetical protein
MVSGHFIGANVLPVYSQFTGNEEKLQTTFLELNGIRSAELRAVDCF